MISGTGGDSGKTLVTLGLIAILRREGIPVIPFKKGPDYIDPAWLTRAAGHQARNLDPWMMGRAVALASFRAQAITDGINLIEANRGLHDGEDAAGTNSSGELAKLLKCPVLLVIPAIKVTRTIAAIALGVKLFDKNVLLRGVIINQIATSRQKSVICRALEDEAGIPVVGTIPRLKGDVLPGRHLGLVTPEEHAQAEKSISLAAGLLTDNVDLDQILHFARNTEAIECQDAAVNDSGLHEPASGKLKIGYFSGPAFTFYYPENLEALTQAGFELKSVNPFTDDQLPEIDALYIGGGFPETHATQLAGNVRFRQAVKKLADQGLPIYAECGGLMFLANSIIWDQKQFPMAGVLDTDVLISRKPAGHGYVEAETDQETPFFRRGVRIRGHEFHYSQVTEPNQLQTGFKLLRGQGIGGQRDGIIHHNVMASYLHIHAAGTPEWVSGIRRAAIQYQRAVNNRGHNIESI